MTPKCQFSTHEPTPGGKYLKFGEVPDAAFTVTVLVEQLPVTMFACVDHKGMGTDAVAVPKPKRRYKITEHSNSFYNGTSRREKEMQDMWDKGYRLHTITALEGTGTICYWELREGQ